MRHESLLVAQLMKLFVPMKFTTLLYQEIQGTLFDRKDYLHKHTVMYIKEFQTNTLGL